MSTVRAIRTPLHPSTRRDRDAVLLELDEVLASPHFCNSKRYPALLRYVVERSLAGEAEQLKERTLGVEVFHRPADYDTHSDTVVRYTAGEVRKRLLLYYHDHETQIQISLPAGSYVPEFLLAADLASEEDVSHPAVDAEVHTHWHATPSEALTIQHVFPEHPPAALEVARSRRASTWAVLAAVGAVILSTAGGWRYWSEHRKSALDHFWAPMLRESNPTLICAGGTVFAPNYSGTKTAGRDTEYPFVSMQVASAIARIDGQLQHYGAAIQMQSSSSTPLTDLRDRPVVLIGGYNNDWTVRLLTGLRYHFAPDPPSSIVDRDNPNITWRRDRSLPYASADDYALIVRFRDATTGSLIVVAAGLGRNGTEAAAQFVTSPSYMNLLEQQAKVNLADRNIEAVLKIKVIEGKTGAPTIEAISVW